MASCSRHRYPAELTAADSLAEVQPDSAVALLKALRPNMADAPEDTKMYYDLLTIKGGRQNLCHHRSNKQIMRLVNYYEAWRRQGAAARGLLLCRAYVCRHADAPRALDYFQRALDTMKDRKDASLKGKIYSQMGYLYMNQYLYDNAIKTFGMAYKYSSEVNDTSSIIYCLSDIASAFTEKGQNRLSLKMLLKAHKLAKKKGDISLINFVEYYMSIRYSSIGEYELAKIYNTCFKKILNHKIQVPYMEVFADIYRLLGKEDSTFYYFNKVKGFQGLYMRKKAAYRFFTRTEIERNGNKKC